MTSTSWTLCTIAALTGGLALATASPLSAPGHVGYRVPGPPFPIPSDCYLDVGAPRLLQTGAGYERPPHSWQREGHLPLEGSTLDETLYVDVGASPGRAMLRQLGATLGRDR